MRFTTGSWAVGLATIAVAAVTAGSALGASQAAPKITGVFPNPAIVGQNFFISGTGLNGAKSVVLNGVPVKFKVVSARAITGSVPKKAKTGKLVVVTKGGTVTTKFTVIPTRFA